MPINRTVIVGNLTRDPELRTAGQTTAVSLRVAVNDRKKDQQTGQWVDAPGYYNVTAFGGLADNVARYTRKGSQVAVDGRLRWHEWHDQQGNKRESIEIVAQDIQFVGPRPDAQQPQGGGGWAGQGQPQQQQQPQQGGWGQQPMAPPGQQQQGPPQQYPVQQATPPPAQQGQQFTPTADDDIPF